MNPTDLPHWDVIAVGLFVLVCLAVVAFGISLFIRTLNGNSPFAAMRDSGPTRSGRVSVALLSGCVSMLSLVAVLVVWLA